MTSPATRALVGSLVGLVAGGTVSAVQLWQDMMVVGLIGASPSEPGLGAAVVTAVLFGAALGLIVDYRPGGYAAAGAAGLLLGVLWWVVESLTLRPLLTGAPVTWSLADAQATSAYLVATMAYGGLTAAGIHGGLSVYVRRRPPIDAPPRRQPVRIVIVGGGFGGVSVAQRLERRLARRRDVAVTLVSEQNFLLFTPMLAGVAAGTLRASHVSAPVRAACPDTIVHQARVDAIDVAAGTIRFDRDGRPPMRYDHLVLALGAVPNFRDLPGVAEHAFALKTLDDAVRLREHVIGQLERADQEPDPTRRRGLLTVVVAGGGFAGAELVAELFDMVHDVRRYYPGVDAAETRFVLVHSQTRILPELSGDLADYSLGKLREKGIDVILGARIAGASADTVVLDDGRQLATRTLVWTAGNRAHPLLRSLPLELTGAGAVVCEPTLRVRGHANIWAVGDCAAMPDPNRPGDVYPPTAQHALRAGRALADNLVAALAGRTGRPFRFTTIGLLVALGHQQAAAEIRGARFSGLLAWLVWRGAYLMRLPGLERKVRVALDWTLDLFFPRDIVLTGSVHTRRVDTRTESA